MTTPIYDRLVAERGDPKQFAAHAAGAWQPWEYAVDKVFDLSAALVVKKPKNAKRRRR